MVLSVVHGQEGRARGARSQAGLVEVEAAQAVGQRVMPLLLVVVHHVAVVGHDQEVQEDRHVEAVGLLWEVQEVHHVEAVGLL